MKSLIIFICLAFVSSYADTATEEISLPAKEEVSKSVVPSIERKGLEKYGYITFGGIPAAMNVGVGYRKNYIEKRRAIDHNFTVYFFPWKDQQHIQDVILLSYQFTPIKYFGKNVYGGIGLEAILPVNINRPRAGKPFPNVTWILGTEFKDSGLKFAQIGINTLPLVGLIYSVIDGYGSPSDAIRAGSVTVLQLNVGF